MKRKICFDHIEVHVSDVRRYCRFLKVLFQDGRSKKISSRGTYMFKITNICIEVKKKVTNNTTIMSGFCNPCLRMRNAKSFIENVLKLKIVDIVENPHGKVYFFIDFEGVKWHIKDYLLKDSYINW